MRISLVQRALAWENPTANRANIEEKIFDLNTDVILLPETFTTGFSVHAPAEPMGGISIKWMLQMAAQTGALVAGTLLISENNKIYNRLIVALPDGGVRYYDKRHLFGLGRENESISRGSKRLIVPFKGVNFAFFTCYDLRFPVWIRNKNLDYDVAVFLANWPAARQHVWQTLLTARALENQAIVAGVNIIGTDGEGLEYHGGSTIINERGMAVYDAENKEEVVTMSIDLEALKSLREKFPVWKDADDFEVKI